MKFSDMLVEYLNISEDLKGDADYAPIARRSAMRDRQQELLQSMDELVERKPGAAA